MIIRYSFWPGVLAVTACFAAIGALAQDPSGSSRDRGRKGVLDRDKDTRRVDDQPLAKGVFVGSIPRVDTASGTLTLRLSGYRGDNTGTGTADKAARYRGTGDRSREAEKDRDRPAPGDPTLDFLVNNKTKVILDGKEAMLGDLAAVPFARVHTAEVTEAGKALPARMTATRVEAFSRAPLIRPGTKEPPRGLPGPGRPGVNPPPSSGPNIDR